MTSSSRPCFIFDLDDTLADNTHRMHLMRAGQWEEYFAQCPADPLIAHVAECANALHAFGYAIIVISGRSESVRKETEAWLEKHLKCFVERTYLRPRGDFRKNSEVKLEALADLRAAGFAPLMAFDDQPETCAMWRLAGVPCAQVRGSEEFEEYKQGA
jgi:phosphoglycolate phosphatase-like HAD superfamily hydrolase